MAGGGIGDFLTDEAVDEIASSMADEGVELASSFLDEMPVNSGQESLCADMQGDVEGAWDDVFNGNPGITIDTPHPEAVGMIAAMCSEVLNSLAAQVKDMRDAAKA